MHKYILNPQKKAKCLKEYADTKRKETQTWQENKLAEPDAQTTGYGDLHIKLEKLSRTKYQVQ
jgi:hypothetical protein